MFVELLLAFLKVIVILASLPFDLGLELSLDFFKLLVQILPDFKSLEIQFSRYLLLQVFQI
jgi:hypothetical protein